MYWTKPAITRSSDCVSITKHFDSNQNVFLDALRLILYIYYI